MAIKFTDVKEKEEVLKVNKSKGIHTPGIVSGHTYTDTNGVKRFKYEVLSTYTDKTVARRLQELQKLEDATNDNETNITPAFIYSEAGKAGIFPETPRQPGDNISINVSVTPSATGLSYDTSTDQLKWTKSTPAGVYTFTAKTDDGNKIAEFVLELVPKGTPVPENKLPEIPPSDGPVVEL